jgi:hypothetical protein
VKLFIPVDILLVSPDSPTRTRLFSQDDKVLLVERVLSSDQGLKQKHFKMNQVIEAAKDPFTYFNLSSHDRKAGLICKTAVPRSPRPDIMANGSHRWADGPASTQ